MLELLRRTWRIVLFAIPAVILLAALAFSLANPAGRLAAPTASASPTTTASPTASATPTPLPSATPTPTPTVTPTATPTPTNTPVYYALAGTPLPNGLAPVSPPGAASLSALAAWREPAVSGLAWLPDGSGLAVGRLEDITFYSLASRAPLRTIAIGPGLAQFSFSPNGAWLTAATVSRSETGSYFSSIRLFRGPTWNPAGPIFEENRALSGMAFTPDGRKFLAAFTSLEPAQNTVEIFPVSRWTVTRTLSTGPLTGIALSPNGGVLASLPDRYAARLWDTRTWRLIVDLETSFTGAVRSAAFSPDGRYFATGHYDGAIRLWEPGKWTLLQTMQTEGVVESLAFSPDGSLLASGENYPGYTLTLWDTLSGAPLRSVSLHTTAVTALLFSRQGELLVSASYDGTIILWGVRP